MRVLLLNWRDPWHPKAGGAELLTQRVLERLASRGWPVEWFSGAYAGAAREEVVGGVRYVRRGGQLSVHAHAFARYRGTRSFDVVVDQINTLPFYGMTYGVPSVAWFQQLAREVWLYEAPAPLSWVGYGLEPVYLAPYRRMPVITISASTAQSLRDIGFRGPIRVLPMATDERVEDAPPAKDRSGNAIVVGRLTPSKRVEESIRAAALLRDSGWDGRLDIVGAGEARYRARLEDLAQEVGLRDRVVFHGRVSAERRSQLLKSASVLWMTSIREGWGLVVTEAASKGTPAVVYDVPGLRDAVSDGADGFVVSPEPAALAAATRRILAQPLSFASAALAAARALSWDRTAEAFASHLKEFVG